MRALVLTLAAVLLVPAAAVAQLDWARAYEDGVEAFKKGNDAIAEQKLIEARDNKRAPKQSRRANFSSTFFKPFIPDFYLGVIYARQGRYAQAQKLLEAALASNLVTQGDKTEFALATTMLQKARDDQGRLATNTNPRPPVIPEKPVEKPVEKPPANPTNSNPLGQQPAPNPQNPTSNTVTPPPVRPGVVSPVTPPPNADPAWLKGFRRALDAGRSSLGQGRYAEARSFQAAARSTAGDGASRSAADALGRDIDNGLIQEAQRIVDRVRQSISRKDAEAAATQVASLESLSPQHVALAGLRREIQLLSAGLQGEAALARVERLGVKLFLSGNYKQAGDALERAVGSRVTSPRVYLFLASSRAAQALLAPQAERPALVAEARRTYELAKPGAGTLAADQRFISPSILQLLAGS